MIEGLEISDFPVDSMLENSTYCVPLTSSCHVPTKVDSATGLRSRCLRSEMLPQTSPASGAAAASEPTTPTSSPASSPATKATMTSSTSARALILIRPRPSLHPRNTVVL